MSQGKRKSSGKAPQKVVLECAGLTKVFRDFWMRSRVSAVDGVSFKAVQGEVLGLLGPNGSGKSTTIKLLLGLLHPTAGKVLVFGKGPGNVGVKSRIGYLPEESYLYRYLNARETLDYYGRLFGLSRQQRQSRTDMLLEMVGLTAVQRRPVGEYSKGMQRRIGLAQALINDPDLLILDEPTTGMDPIGSRQIKDVIIELSRRGKTVLLCSHLLADVEDVCDRVAIMFGGKIRTMGRVDDLLVQQGVTTLQTPTLDVGTIEQIESLLQKQGKHIEKVDQPRQKLETLFLDIVNRAHNQGVSTSGARRSGRIAQFLRAEGLSTGPQSGKPKPSRTGPTQPVGGASPGSHQPAPEDVTKEDLGLIDSISGNWQTNSEETMVGQPVKFTELDLEKQQPTKKSPPPSYPPPTPPQAAKPRRSLLDELKEATDENHDSNEVDPVDSTSAQAPDVEKKAREGLKEDYVEPIVEKSDPLPNQVAELPSEEQVRGDLPPKVIKETLEYEAPDSSFLDALSEIEPYVGPEEEDDEQATGKERPEG